MRRAEPYKLQKVTLNLRDGDFGILQDLHGRIGASKVIRELVIGHIERTKEAAAQKVDPLPIVTIKEVKAL